MMKNTTATFVRALGTKKPAIIKERGEPRFVVLEWETWHAWKEMEEDMEDHIRFEIALREAKGKKRYALEEVRKKYKLT